MGRPAHPQGYGVAEHRRKRLEPNRLVATIRVANFGSRRRRQTVKVIRST
jgi:hypothetical protein